MAAQDNNSAAAAVSGFFKSIRWIFCLTLVLLVVVR